MKEKKTEHTPEPWYAREGSGGQGLIISESNGVTVAVSYDAKDALILAAAPDLLAACKAQEEASAARMLAADKDDARGRGKTPQQNTDMEMEYLAAADEADRLADLAATMRRAAIAKAEKP